MVETREVQLKDAKTYEEQLSILKSRNLLVIDESDAISYLQKANYYRLSAYGLTLKDPKDRELFMEGTTFDHLVALYEFDQKMRNLLLSNLETIEVAFRTQIAYHLGHQYGPLGYKNPIYFWNAERHATFLKKLDDFFKRYEQQELFIKHHQNKYNGEFPIWVAIEVLSFSNLSLLYKNLKNGDKKKIARNYYNSFSYPYIESWLHSLSYIRNTCAHFGRLYGKKLAINVKLYKDIDRIQNDELFAAILIMKNLLIGKDSSMFVINLHALIEEYSSNLNLEYIGFPSDWKVLLKG